MQVPRNQISLKIFLEDRYKICYPRLHLLLVFYAGNSSTWHTQAICSSSILHFSPEHLFLPGKSSVPERKLSNNPRLRQLAEFSESNSYKESTFNILNTCSQLQLKNIDIWASYLNKKTCTILICETGVRAKTSSVFPAWRCYMSPQWTERTQGDLYQPWNYLIADYYFVCTSENYPVRKKQSTKQTKKTLLLKYTFLTDKIFFFLNCYQLIREDHSFHCWLDFCTAVLKS